MLVLFLTKKSRISFHHKNTLKTRFRLVSSFKGKVEITLGINTKYTSDSTASLYVSDKTGFFLEEVNPGSALTSNVVFDISQDADSASDLQLQVQTGF